MTDRENHWAGVYKERSPDRVSWYQAAPAQSIKLIRHAVSEDARIIDVGGGASTLADHLLDAGYSRLTVLDIAAPALVAARQRLGPRAKDVNWITADVTDWSPTAKFNLWHDRAVFHFLTDAEDRRAYVRTLRAALAPDGHLIVATFALDGPETCSGLPVARYNADRLSAELGQPFVLMEEQREDHLTPGGTTQSFGYYRYRIESTADC